MAKKTLHKADPRQQTFLSYYLDPKSETWGNAYKSAIKAKYSKDYAESITVQNDWLQENLEDSKLLTLALSNLEEFMKTNKKHLQSIRWDASKVTLKGLGKSRFSERSEVTGKDGKDLSVNLIKYES